MLSAPVVVSNPLPEDSAVRAAQLSLYVYDYFDGVSPSFLPDRLQPRPLEDAAMVVAYEALEFDTWCALAHLIGHRLHLVPENRPVVEALVEGLLRKYEESRQEAELRYPAEEWPGLSPELMYARIEKADPENQPGATRLERQRNAEARIFDLRRRSRPGNQPTCDPPETTVSFDPRTLVTTVDIRIENIRGRPSEDMAFLVNPLFWSDFHEGFVQAYRCESSEEAAVNPPMLRAYQGLPREELALRHWRDFDIRWDGPFFEQVQINDPYSDDLLAEFRNILSVYYSGLQVITVGQPLVEMNFSLERSLTTRLGSERLGPGMDVDNGFAIVETSGNAGVWSWRAVKKLRFRDLTPNLIVTSAFDFGQWLNYLTPALAGASLSDSMHAAALKEAPFDFDARDLASAGKAGLTSGSTALRKRLGWKEYAI